jgi:hypothetical protein
MVQEQFVEGLTGQGERGIWLKDSRDEALNEGAEAEENSLEILETH